MNTSAVSKILGVSQSTVQRWVKHLELQMERNEFGHYIYSEEDIELLKDFQEQIQNGVPIQEIKITRKPRKGTVRLSKKPIQQAPYEEKIHEIEKKLEQKADSVVSYQLLQHRKEIEELRNQIGILQRKLENIYEEHKEPDDDRSALNKSGNAASTSRKRRFLGILFGS